MDNSLAWIKIAEHDFMEHASCRRVTNDAEINCISNRIALTELCPYISRIYGRGMRTHASVISDP
jgi:hypothetical protein